MVMHANAEANTRVNRCDVMMPSFASWNYSKVRIDFATTPNPFYSKWYICVPNEDDTTVYQNVKPAQNAVGHQHLHIEFQNRDLSAWSRHSSPAIGVRYLPHAAPILRTSNTGAHICVLIVVLTRKHSEGRDSWKPLATNSTGTWHRCSRAV